MPKRCQDTGRPTHTSSEGKLPYTYPLIANGKIQKGTLKKKVYEITQGLKKNYNSATTFDPLKLKSQTNAMEC